jgi:hypothetical protein
MEMNVMGTTNRNLAWLWLLFLAAATRAQQVPLPPLPQQVPSAIAQPSSGLSAIHIALIIGFVLIFFIVVALFAWLIISMSAKEKRYRLMIQQGFTQGREDATNEMNVQIHSLEDELGRLRDSMPDISDEAIKEATDVICGSAGHAQIMLIHMGGQRDGYPETLRTRDEVTQRAVKVKIGRNAEKNDVPIPWDTTISDPHCEISFDGMAADAKFYVYDLNSTNGVHIKRGTSPFKKIDTKEYLDDADILRVGHSEFRVVTTKPVEQDGSLAIS